MVACGPPPPQAASSTSAPASAPAASAAKPAASAPASAEASAKPAASAPASAAASAKPAGSAAAGILAGLLVPTTGNAAASGQDMVNGWNLYWKQNPSISGRTVQTAQEDTASDPTVALNKAHLLVEQRKVTFLIGPLLANEGLAVADYAKTVGIPTFEPIVSADDLTQRHRIDNVVRIAGWTSSQGTHPFGEWAYDQGYRKVVTICTDYAFGQEKCGGFAQTFTGKGGQIVAQLWNPLNTPDFSSYLTQIPGKSPDAVFALQVGADAPRFMKQWGDFGFKTKFPLLGGEVLTDASLLRSMGSEAEGVISEGHWAEGRDDKSTQDFVKTYMEAYNQLPSYYAGAMYSAAEWIAKSGEQVGGKLEDSKAFLDAVKKLTLPNSVLGPLKLDEYGNPVYNIYIRKVEKRPDGKLWNVPIKTYENVSQFWTYKPEDYLKQPVYSREFQGIKGQQPVASAK